MRQSHRLPRPLIRRRMLDTLIKHHRNIRPQSNLHIHRVLRREEMFAPIQMRPKLHPFRRNLPQPAQTEHLKPTRVRQHRPLPTHKPMHSTHPPHQLMPRPQIEMIRIRQNDLRALPPRQSPPAHPARTAFTEAAVPTGINTGVSTTPCGSVNRPLRPPPSAALSISNENAISRIV